MTETAADLQQQLARIRDLLHGAHRNAVLPVVGSGLSLPYLLGWRAFLEELVDGASPQDRPALRRRLEEGSYLDVAAVLEDDPLVRHQGVADAIRRHYAQPRVMRPRIYDLVARLPVDHFVTTNFDPWLKQAVRAKYEVAPKVYTSWDRAAWRDVAPSSSPLVLMLHGDADRPEECVLSADAFNALIHRNDAFRVGFITLVGARSLLFLGHSLRDPDLVLMLETWSSAMAAESDQAAPRHFILTTELDVVDRKRFRSYGVLPVEFGPPGDYSRLPEILEYLGTPPPVERTSGFANVQQKRGADRPAAAATPPPVDPRQWEQVNRVVAVYRSIVEGKNDEAHDTLSGSIAEFGPTPPLMTVQNVILSRAGEFERVRDISRQLQAARALSPAEEALLHWNLGEGPAALARSVEALIEDPTNALAWLVRGGTLIRDDVNKAQRNVDAALLFLRLYEAWALRLRAQILLRLDRPEQALQAATLALERTPHSPAAYDTRSSVLLKLNRTAEALDDLENAIRLAPKWADPRRMKAAVLADERRHAEAVVAASDALRVGGDDSLMLHIRAESLLALRRHAEAAADVAHARRLDPESTLLAKLAETIDQARREA